MNCITFLKNISCSPSNGFFISKTNNPFTKMLCDVPEIQCTQDLENNAGALAKHLKHTSTYIEVESNEIPVVYFVLSFSQETAKIFFENERMTESKLVPFLRANEFNNLLTALLYIGKRDTGDMSERHLLPSHESMLSKQLRNELQCFFVKNYKFVKGAYEVDYEVSEAYLIVRNNLY